MMFRRPTVTIALCLLSLALASRRASADLVLTFEPDQTTYNVGDSVQVSVYVEDFNPNDPSDSALNPGAGLSGGALTKFGFKGSIDPAVFVLPSGGFVVNPSVDLSGSLSADLTNPNLTVFTVTGYSTSVFDTGTYGSAVLDSNQQLAGFSLKLGTLMLTAKTATPGSSITFTDSEQGGGFKISGTTYTVTDLNVNSPLTLQVNQPVSAVPEPGSMSLVALAGAGSMWLAHRRRRRSAK